MTRTLYIRRLADGEMVKEVDVTGYSEGLVERIERTMRREAQVELDTEECAFGDSKYDEREEDYDDEPASRLS